MRRSSNSRALAFTVVGSAFWGLSGTAAQALFKYFNFPVVGLLSIRLLCGGAILLAFIRPRKPDRRDVTKLIIVALLGFLGSQLTYLLAIQNSNAATATLLQFLFLPIVALYEALTGTIRWSFRWTAVVLLAIVGTLLLIGAIGFGVIHLLITEAGLAFGLLAACCASFYALYSRPIVREKGPWWLVTWGFALGGVFSAPFGALALSDYATPRAEYAQLEVIGLAAFVLVFGTILAYGSFLTGLQRLTATEVSVISSLEPITAAAAAYAFLGVVLTGFQYLGGALILAAVVMIALQDRRKPERDLAAVKN
jgi:drug/metabolite transporter (DMT)-like permease